MPFFFWPWMWWVQPIWLPRDPRTYSVETLDGGCKLYRIKGGPHG
jgi:hypothetical protein